MWSISYTTYIIYSMNLKSENLLINETGENIFLFFYFERISKYIKSKKIIITTLIKFFENYT